MCGRFANSETLVQTGLRLAAEPADDLDWHPSFNCGPGTILPTVIEDGRGRRLGAMRWGWSRDWQKGLLINARVEKSAISRLWSAALETRRCVLPCTGWWEWLKEGGVRRPYFHRLADGSPFALAGLWEYVDKEGVFVVLTTAALAPIVHVHDRMPVLLPDGAVPGWLAEGALPAAAETPEFSLVETRPFGMKDDGPELVRPVDPDRS